MIAARGLGALALLVLLAGGAEAAQSLGIGGKSDKPIEVYADDGIEWDKNTRQYIARGNAKAIQGTTTVYGDTLIAYYEEAAGGTTEIYRLDAIGNVRIVSPSETAYGGKAVYDVRKGVLVMTGDKLRLVTAQEVVTARDSLEYYEEKGLAVARGNAVSKPLAKTGTAAEGRTVRADVLSARFRDEGDAGNASGSTIERLDAWGNVVVTRPGEVALGARGVYFPKTDLAHLWGDVRITREGNQLNGDYAEVNFRTGISRILSGPRNPVQALIQPEKTPENPAPQR